VLTNEQILDIARLGKEMEAHFGSPQDIEFCVEKKKVYVVQSRPITSLYPLPDIPPEPLRVLISFGHIQMMTHAMKPLGLSVLRTMVPQSIFLEAGGRLYVDLTEALRLKLGRRIIPNVLIHADEGISRAVKAVIQRHVFRQVPPKRGMLRFFLPLIAPIVKEVFKNLVLRDPGFSAMSKRRRTLLFTEILLGAMASMMMLTGLVMYGSIAIFPLYAMFFLKNDVTQSSAFLLPLMVGISMGILISGHRMQQLLYRALAKPAGSSPHSVWHA
jgi:hypothetical protein